ncbi:MAG: hypothetical protein M3Y87_37285, partial [Myxococcota bacterium]|nr:hypothetical protein [Myxococcota bacterium]
DAALGRWDAMLARARDCAAPLRLYTPRETIIARELMVAAATAEGAGRDDATREALLLAAHHLDKPHTRAEHAALLARLDG